MIGNIHTFQLNSNFIHKYHRAFQKLEIQILVFYLILLYFLSIYLTYQISTFRYLQIWGGIQNKENILIEWDFLRKKNSIKIWIRKFNNVLFTDWINCSQLSTVLVEHFNSFNFCFCHKFNFRWIWYYSLIQNELSQLEFQILLLKLYPREGLSKIKGKLWKPDELWANTPQGQLG